MVASFKTNLLDWLKTKVYVKNEIDTKLQNKSDISHTHDISDLYDDWNMISGILDELNEKADKSVVTTSVNGLMSKEDKSKLDGIATEANKTVVDSSLSSSSTNPVQNKVVNSALSGKANSSHSHSISNITNLQSALNSKSNTGHEHTSDEIHYAYDQNVSVTTILENKAAKKHTHDYIPSTVSQTVFGSGDSKVTATRQGNVVTLRLYLAGEFTESWTQWCTITDSQYLPDTDEGFTDFGISSSHGTHMLLRINSDGKVRTGYGQNKTGYCYQTITFLKNN